MSTITQDARNNLTLIVVESFSSYPNHQELSGLGKAGVQLVKDVYKETDVPHGDELVLSWKDGKVELNGTGYNQMFLLHHRRLVGVRYSQEMHIKGFGKAVES